MAVAKKFINEIGGRNDDYHVALKSELQELHEAAYEELMYNDVDTYQGYWDGKPCRVEQGQSGDQLRVDFFFSNSGGDPLEPYHEHYISHDGGKTITFIVDDGKRYPVSGLVVSAHFRRR